MDTRTVLETERLTFRYGTEEDAEIVAAIWADEEVMRFMGGPRNRENTARLVREEAAKARDALPRFSFWSTVEKETGEVIGDCGLLLKEIDGEEMIELNYIFARSRWGRGYATEAARAIVAHAFDAAGLRRVVALIDPKNRASARVAEKAGLTLRRQTVRPSGKVMDLYFIDRPA